MNKRIKAKKAKMFISELKQFQDEIKDNTNKLIVNNDPYMDRLALIFDKYHYSYKTEDYDEKDIYYFFESFEFMDFEEQYFVVSENAEMNPNDESCIETLEEFQELAKDNNNGYYIGCNLYGVWFMATVANLGLLIDDAIYSIKN